MRPSISARLTPTFSGVRGAGTHSSGLSAVRTSMPVDPTDPVADCDVANIRHGLKGHQWSLPTSDPAQNSPTSASVPTVRHALPARPSRTIPCAGVGAGTLTLSPVVMAERL